MSASCTHYQGVCDHLVCPRAEERAKSEAAEADLRARHAALCERINEEATPFREAPLPAACAERDRLWARIQELETEEES